MMEGGRWKIGVALLLCCTGMGLGLGLAAQNRSMQSLQNDIKKYEEEIRINTRLLETTRTDQKANATQVKLIRSRIDNRQKIVASLEEQIALIDSDIASRSDDVSKMEAQREELKGEYSRLVYESYKNYKVNNFLLFLFAAEDFNDASRRVDFMRRYNRQMEIKVGEIDSLSRIITVEIGQLDAKKIEASRKKDERTREVASLDADRKQYERSSARLKSEEQKISKELTAKRSAMKKAQDQIAKIMAEEARKARREPRTTEQKQQDVALSGQFGQNKGKLPYPIRGGVIIDRFGVHTSSVSKEAKVDNKGVNIAGTKGAPVYCIFEGTAKVILTDWYRLMVFVRSGDYCVVYANLDKVNVKTGDKVALNQVIGNISAGGDANDYVLHLEIWKGMQFLDPEGWLRR